nr:hypothetical protein [Ammoniphilus resinae]
MIQTLKKQQKEILAVIHPPNETRFCEVLKKQGIPFIINGVDPNERLYHFVGKPTKLKKSFVFIGPAGGSGKSFLSSFAAKKASRNNRVRLVDWNFETPSLHHFFNVPPLESIVKGIKLLRNDLPINLTDYDFSVDKNLTVTPMYLDYLESTKWGVEEFAYLWDQYEQGKYDVVIYEVPNYPFSVTASVALMRATDIVITLLPEQNSIFNSIQLINWIKTHRESDMPNVHFVINRYKEEIAMGISQIEKTLDQKMINIIPEIPNALGLFLSGELMQERLPKSLIEKVSALNSFVENIGFRSKEEEATKGEISLLNRIFKKDKRGETDLGSSSI